MRSKDSFANRRSHVYHRDIVGTALRRLERGLDGAGGVDAIGELTREWQAGASASNGNQRNHAGR